MKKMWKKKIGAVVLTIAMLTTFGCGSVDSQQGSAQESTAAETQSTKNDGEPINVKVGLLFPLTGSNAKTGKLSVDAIEAYFDIVNEAHPELEDIPFAADAGLAGLNYGKIEWVVADTQTSPETGMAEAERLITQENVDVIMGCLTSSVTKTVSNVCERYGVPLVNSLSTSKELTERGLEYYFRVTPTDKDFIRDTLDYLDAMNQEKGADIKTIALFTEDTEFGSKLRDQVLEQINDHPDLQITVDVPYSATATNLSAEIMKMKDSGADALICAGQEQDTILMFKTMKEQNWMPKIIVGQRGGLNSADTVKNIGVSSLEGIATTIVYSPDLLDTIPTLQTVTDIILERSGETELADNHVRCWTGAYVLLDAINRAGTNDSEAIKDALVETDIVNEGQMIVPWEGVQFDDTHQNTKGSTLIVAYQNGELKTVYPFQYATIDPLYPLPAWSER